MILTHQSLARAGYSTGGNPPYGHVRALFDRAGNFVEILPKGRAVRQEGYHVRWVPGDDDENREKIKTWLLILQLSEQGLGGERIANHLNHLGIPSPGAGTERTDHGVKHRVSGKWNQSTVLALIRNATISGIKTYGKQAEGKYRRLDEAGWRHLNDRERNEKGTPKVNNNPDNLIIKAPSGAEPSFDPNRFESIQEQLKNRGRNQRGIPRAKDPSKYPLSCRIIDLTNGCGSVMYGANQSGRLVYKCGRYLKSGGDECNNNGVDAEALLGHVLGSLLTPVRAICSRPNLKAELLKLARAELGNKKVNSSTELEVTESKIVALKNEAELILRNLARARDDETYAEIESERERVIAQIRELNDRRLKLTNNCNGDHNLNPTTAEREVEKALSQLKHIEQIASNPEGRIEIRRMLDGLGCRIGVGCKK